MAITLQAILREARRLKSLTQSQVADKLSLSRSTYADKEIKGDFTQAELKSLSKILGIPLGKLTEAETEGGEVIFRNPQQYLLHASVRMESMLRVILRLAAEDKAIRTNRPLDEMLKELEALVNSESEHHLKSL